MTRDRTATITFGTRAFPIIIAGDDKHDWRLADPKDGQEFERLWGEMEARMQRRAAA